jgi:hypothetical protein
VDLQEFEVAAEDVEVDPEDFQLDSYALYRHQKDLEADPENFDIDLCDFDAHPESLMVNP